ANAGRLNVHVESRKIDTFRRAPPVIFVASLQVGLKLLLQIRANRLPVSDTEQRRFWPFRLSFSKGHSFLLENFDGERGRHVIVLSELGFRVKLRTLFRELARLFFHSLF